MRTGRYTFWNELKPEHELIKCGKKSVRYLTRMKPSRQEAPVNDTKAEKCKRKICNREMNFRRAVAGSQR